MLCLMVMAILVALSDLFDPEQDEYLLNHNITTPYRVPIYIAVLYAFLFPVVASFMIMIVNYSNKTLKLRSTDWVQAHLLLYGIITAIVAFVYFTRN